MQVFVNQSITDGITTYLRDKNENRIFAPFCFEKKIIESLVAIYGETNITNPYLAGTADVFLQNLKIYGLSDNELMTFLGDFEAVSKWIRDNKGIAVKPKTNLLVILEKRLMTMILAKSKVAEVSEEEMAQFEKTLFIDKCNNPTQILFARSLTDEVKDLSMYWEFKKYQIKNKMSLKKEETPTYLSQEDYLAFNISSEMLKNMTKQQIDELNTKIIEYRNQINAMTQSQLTYRQQNIRSGFVNNIIIVLVIIICVLVSVILIVKLGKGV